MAIYYLAVPDLSLGGRLLLLMQMHSRAHSQSGDTVHDHVRACAEVQNGATATTMEQRAQQLADVAATLYDAADSRSIRLPLQPSHLLVIALRKALDRELKSGGSVKSQMAAGRKLADALLEGFLQAQDEGQSCFSHVMVYPFPLLQITCWDD